MLDIQRVKKIISWLVFSKKINNNKDLAQKMGYTESSLSQIINEKVPLSNRFIKKLSIVDEEINLNWLLTGEGSMLREEKSPPNTAEEKLWGLIKEKDAKIEELSKQIGKLEAIIDSLNAKKSHSGGAVDAICAAVG